MEHFNVFSLSEITNFGTPLLPINLLRQFTKAIDDKSGTSSKWSAPEEAQVYNAMYALFNFPFFECTSRTYTGPAKSTPTRLNAISSETRKSGKFGGAA